MPKSIWNPFRRRPKRQELASRSFRSMGGVATLTLGASCSQDLEFLSANVRALFERLESDLSRHRPGSCITRLAENAGVAPVAVSEDAHRVLEFSRQFDGLSLGASDITVAPLVDLWGFGVGARHGEIPSDADIRRVLPLVDHRRIVLEKRVAFLPQKGMAVDLGGIAKGYAVDRAFELCRHAGADDFLVDLSGNLRVSGHPDCETNWQIGVRDPFDRSRILGRVDLPSGMALASSGNYERYIEVACQRYSHVIDPRTGFPAEGTAGVTVLARDALTADGLSTSFFVLGFRGAAKLLERMAAVELLVMPDMYPPEIWVTRGFAGVFTPIPLYSTAVNLLERQGTRLSTVSQV